MAASRKITSAAYRDEASKVLGEAFKTDPVIRFMTSSLSQEAHHAYLPSYMRTLLTAASLNDAIFQEIGDWSCCAVWIPPGRRVDNPFTIIQSGFFPCLIKLGLGGVKRMLLDYASQSTNCKKQHLKNQDCYYLFFIGTKAECRGKGLAKEIVREFQARAANEGTPIWLEATTSHSRDIYTSCGFDTVAELSLGKGSHGSDGETQKGGPGVPIWAMVWYPGIKTSEVEVETNKKA